MKKLLILVVSTLFFTANAQDKEVKITIDPLSDHIYMLTGRGGNIGVFKNEKGLFIIDDQFARLSDKILSNLKTISDLPVTMVINTHYHGDHTGGNENMTNQGATIFAQKNVRSRMEKGQKKKGRIIPSSLPVITFSEGLQLYFKDENVKAFHVHNAHTDGDALIYFVNGNVLHMGDTFFNGRYPYIDLKSGGSIKGYIKASEKALLIANDDTKIIPGHGKLATKKDLETFLEMLNEITSSIQKEIKAGKSEEDITKNTSLTATYDAKGYGDGFINSERMRKTIYTSLTK
ncbi:glyoxylase-like metal-dependent hydrolase (beta-lactamase superfamily II) [Aquimarina sp. EL_43]|uniref:MBL fold metallo-hydrolase n=1 Tax=unclassified Aquimarina TaxID=2627091 RepID=UPI0018CBE659|nr:MULTISPECIES: MBL fold metallo-hydrolase [unclassified Aquimarina]MBG6132960.1 glyoxylase-like metal-dependent hydrolase (beta-lactamase superfamily II) [Aquimarina sp. EL_35]MBG6152271.1 glyoxylase-like metal-dependent hydrolase (beta-lactamase superfamily II) [Aquimarina sp. EL_32]MBG6171109.1 glyoxylase-like metal-dependent hydrolase (beta-lactamase superfamily II) [Aquimarina sp. EL_43]